MLIKLALQLWLIDIDAHAGIDGNALVASGDLFGLDFKSLADAARTVLLRSSFLGDVSSNDNFGSVGEAKQAGITGVITAAHLNRERSQEKESP